MNVRLIFTLLFGLFAFDLPAQVILPPVLGDHMILKQNSEVQIWGKARPNTNVEVLTNWNQKRYTTQADENGRFAIPVTTTKGGGPYSIAFENDGIETVVTNVLLGEVWFCSGQSNMDMAMKGRNSNEPVLNSEQLLADANNSNIRIFNTVKAVSFEELKSARGKWVVSTPETAANTSAVAWQFAQMLQQELKVPVGIITSAWGGTPIRSWMSRESLKNFPAISLKQPDTVTSKTPAALFNGMVAPITPYTISGFLWYQGENDHRNAETYKEMMPAMVRDWRARFENQKLPFYFVQIAPWWYDRNGPPLAAYFREMQYELRNTISFSGIAVTTDVGSDKTIHPENKTAVARRLVKLALARTYGKKESCLGPEYKDMRIKGNKAILSFRNAKGLHLAPEAVNNFEIAGEDRVFHKANAIVRNGKVEVWADEVQKPVAVRYAFENFAQGNLFNGSGLPASTFRTDDWPANM